MYLFNCDYNEGAHPKILEALMRTNLEQTPGYGEDGYCGQARDLIQKACQNDAIAVHFLVGGTQANFTVISAALRAHQGVLSPETGHINVHETGAVEATGHKVLSLPCGNEGKLTAEQIGEACRLHANDASFEHMVQPKMVYISHPTENGSLYTKAELAALRTVCDKWGLYLFLDGARLGYGLTARGTDVTLPDLCRLCDVFYIGGTKCGALFGEAVVIVNDALKTDFRYFIKQKGAMLAKGRLLGLQFRTLFTDDLYFSITKKANEQAYRIADACIRAGFRLLCDSPTNQQFLILPDSKLEKLGMKYKYAYWARYDKEHSVIRLCTSWATQEETVDQLVRDILSL